MNDTNNVSTAVPAGAGAATSEAAAGAGATTNKNHAQTCPTAGKDAMDNKDENKSAATVAEAQPKSADAGNGAQADAGAKGKKGKGKKTAEESAQTKTNAEAMILIPFSALVVSKWNESHGAPPNKEHIEDLRDDIKRNKLMHPVTLIPNTGSSGAKYAILTGARRVAALTLLRGENSGLKFGEFTINSKLDESKQKCLDYSLSENAHRYGRSVIDRAVFIGRMRRVESIPQEKLAKRLSTRREVVCRLEKLAACAGSLPECWFKDLSFAPKSGGKEPKKTDLPRISLSHWIEVAPHLDEGESVISDKIKTVMTSAHAKKWSTRTLRAELELVHPIKPQKESKDPEEAARAKAAKQATLENARLRKSLQKAYDKAKANDPSLAEQYRLMLERLPKKGGGDGTGTDDASAPEPGADEPAADAKPATAEATEAKPTA